MRPVSNERRIEMKQKLTEEIVSFVSENPANCLPGCSTPYYDSPLTGFASVVDPLFTSYKTIIGDFHLTPGELFAGEFGEISFVRYGNQLDTASQRSSA